MFSKYDIYNVIRALDKRTCESSGVFRNVLRRLCCEINKESKAVPDLREYLQFSDATYKLATRKLLGMGTQNFSDISTPIFAVFRKLYSFRTFV